MRDAMYAGGTVTSLDYVSIGSGENSAKKTDTGLETFIENKLAVKTAIGIDRTSYMAEWDYGEGNGNTISEAGLSTVIIPDPSDVYGSRKVFPKIIKNNTFKLRITIYTKVEDNSR